MARKVPLPFDLNSITATPLSELAGWLITTAAYTGCCIVVTWKRCFDSIVIEEFRPRLILDRLVRFRSIFFFNQCNEEKENFVCFRTIQWQQREFFARPYRCVTIYFSWPKDRKTSGVDGGAQNSHRKRIVYVIWYNVILTTLGCEDCTIVSTR